MTTPTAESAALPWRETNTLIHAKLTVPDAVLGAYKKLNELYDDWKRHRGAYQLTVITTQLQVVEVKHPAEGIAPERTEQVYWFLITYQIDGIEPRVARGKQKR